MRTSEAGRSNKSNSSSSFGSSFPILNASQDWSKADKRSRPAMPAMPPRFPATIHWWIIEFPMKNSMKLPYSEERYSQYSPLFKHIQNRPSWKNSWLSEIRTLLLVQHYRLVLNPPKMVNGPGWWISPNSCSQMQKIPVQTMDEIPIWSNSVS